MAACLASGSLADTAVAGLEFAIAGARSKLGPASVSLYSGATGVALAAVEVAHRLQRAGLRRSAISLARRVAALVSKRPEGFETDLIEGLSGIVIGLLAIHRQCGDPALLDACRVACEHLARARRDEWWGSSWPDRKASQAEPPLCGLGHGMSGIGWALAETGWATGESKFLAIAKEAFRYELSWFSGERCAWPDLREPTAQSDQDGSWPAWTVAWCHGALGIGAVRLRFYEIEQDLSALAEATAAIQAARTLVAQSGAVLRQGQFSDVTLCHGLGGAAELMLLAHEVTGIPDHQRAARRVGDLCRDTFTANHQRWTCGLPKGERVPGLFLGLAGIGVTMMRLHDASLIGSPMLPGRLPKKQDAASQ
jgi:lantibiotic modifying enzyme